MSYYCSRGSNCYSAPDGSVPGGRALIVMKSPEALTRWRKRVTSSRESPAPSYLPGDDVGRPFPCEAFGRFDTLQVGLPTKAGEIMNLWQRYISSRDSGGRRDVCRLPL